MKVAVIMNARAGSIGTAQATAQAEAIRAAFAAVGVEAEIHACAGPKLTATARAAARGDVDAVVAAGGDGTVSAVAAALAGGEMPLAVLPLGTLNHFARDLGMPDDLAEAARAIAARRFARVDVGEVNGRVFVNNSSIGLYPEMVVARDAEQRRRGIGKWRAMVIATWRVLRRFPLLAVHILVEMGALVSRTPLVFVGNNEYHVSAPTLGQRHRLDGGRLSLYMLRCRGRWKMFRLMVRALLQRPEAIDEFEHEVVTEARVDVRRRYVKVAFDGEVATMATPLYYRIRRGALPMLVPPTSTAVAADEPARADAVAVADREAARRPAAAAAEEAA